MPFFRLVNPALSFRVSTSRASIRIRSLPKRIGGCRMGGPTTSADRLFGGRTFSGGEVSLRAPGSVALTWVVIRKFGLHTMTRSRRITKIVGNDRLRPRPGQSAVTRRKYWAEAAAKTRGAWALACHGRGSDALFRTVPDTAGGRGGLISVLHRSAARTTRDSDAREGRAVGRSPRPVRGTPGG